MSPLKQLKTRQQKVEFLKGLLAGKNRIYEIMDIEFLFFGTTEDPEKFYLAERTARLMPMIVDGKQVLFDQIQIDRIKKLPNYVCNIFSFDGNGKHYPEHLALALAEYNEQNLPDS